MGEQAYLFRYDPGSDGGWWEPVSDERAEQLRAQNLTWERQGLGLITYTITTNPTGSFPICEAA